MKMSNKTYDRLKSLCQIILPAALTIITAVMALNGADEQLIAAVAAIGSAVITALGSYLGISSAQYNDEMDSYVEDDDLDIDDEVCTATPTNLTMTVEDLIAIAKAEVGYVEKASNKDLDDPLANAGTRNYTKYGRDLRTEGYYNGNKNGQEWCCLYMDWIFLKGAGSKSEAAKYKPQGSCGASCKYVKNYFTSIGRLYNYPMVGDQVIFKGSDGKPCHTGLVIEVTDTTIKTIEGNCSNKVSEKSYKRNSSYIGWYGRPYYAESKPEPEPVVEELKVGDIVMLNAEAKVYGKTYGFKSWVYSRKLYVRKISGDKVTVSTLKVGAVTGSTYRNMVTKIQ